MILHVKEKSASYKISNSKEVMKDFEELGESDQESFHILGCNIQNQPILKECIGLGGMNFCPIDIKIIFKRLLVAGCSSFFCIHNHPTGVIKPSQEDKNITENIKKAADILDIKFIDHLIIGDKGNYFSFADERLL